MKFSKMHGLGNDFVMIDCLQTPMPPEEQMADLSESVCDRHFGVGGDGLILILPDAQADYRMRMWNPDGSESEMCGNGIRCFGKYLFDAGLVGESAVSVATTKGLQQIEIQANGALPGAHEIMVRVDMGAPHLLRSQIPMLALPPLTRATTSNGGSTNSGSTNGGSSGGSVQGGSVNGGSNGGATHGTGGLVNSGAAFGEALSGSVADAQVVDQPLQVGDAVYNITAVSMGNPHVVIFVDDVESVALKEIGLQIEHHEAFPERTNVHFVQVLGPGKLWMRTWERGAGDTLACGTGACAVVVASALNGRLNSNERRALVHLPGGDLDIEWATNNHVYMTGPATSVFEAEFDPKFLEEI
jgi:diaminopimelate epimerase